MPPETALLESRALRDSVIERTDALDKVKILTMLPDGVHVTTRIVAAYFEVGEEAIKSLAKRHREEFHGNGMHTLRGSDLQTFHRSNMDLWDSSYPQAITQLTLYPRRAVLNVAMLLRDSDIARRVRMYLLDIEERARESGTGRLPLEQILTERLLEGPIGTRLDAVESRLSDVGSALRELTPWLARMSARLDGMDQRLDAHGRVICAMSERLCDLGEDMKKVRRDLARLKTAVEPGRAARGRGRRRR